MTSLVALTCLLAAQASPWTLNPNNTLVWQGEPYLPVGLRIDGSVDAVVQADQAGVKDVLVQLPGDGGGWAPVLAELNQRGMRYLIAVDSLAPSAEGVAVEPEAYRVAGITGPRSFELSVPGGTDALVLLAAQRDGAVAWQNRMPLAAGRAKLEVDPRTDLPHVLLMYPRVRDLRVTDFWEGFDGTRDALLAALTRNEMGPGFRGIVDPLGVVAGFPAPDTSFVPSSPLFQLELAQYLERRYGKLDVALRAWTVGLNDLKSFADLARLVPLWAESRGVQNLWDPATDRLYSAIGAQSNAWDDIRAVVRATAVRRYSRFVAAIRRQFDVPVVQTWVGWNGPYEEASALDGVAFSAREPGLLGLVQNVSRPASSVLRRSGTTWLLAGDLRFGEDSLETRVAETESLGARGWFVTAGTDEERLEVARLARARVGDTGPAEWKPTAVFYPEAATNPAYPMRLQGGLWWLPSPAQGEPIDFGAEFAGYRYADATRRYTALWRRGGQDGRALLRVANPKSVRFVTLDGVEVQGRVRKEGTEIALGPTPLLAHGDEIPVPETALGDVIAKIRLTITGDASGFADGARGQLATRTAGISANPGGAYLSLLEELADGVRRLAPFVWLEGESTASTNFSTPIRQVGCSGGAALRLVQRLSLPGEVSYAEYTFRPRAKGLHEVWVAARMPESATQPMTVRVGNTLLRPEPGLTSLYGLGFGWMKLGTVELGDSTYKLVLELPATASLDLAIDAIVLAPGSFQPDGRRMPTDWMSSLTPIDPTRRP